jgi:hypothetical protein
LQKLQTSPAGTAYDGQWWRLFTQTAESRAQSFLESMPRREYLAAAAAGILIVGLMPHTAWTPALVFGIVAAVILPWGFQSTRHHVSGLLIVFVLIEAAAASSFAAGSNDNLGGLIRYPVGLLFVLPFVTSVWNSGILRKGGFRDYAIYLIFALVSVSYSILPAVSFARAIAAILPFCALCAIAAELRSGDEARRVMGAMLAGCGIVVAANYLVMAIPGIVTWQPDTDTGMLRFIGLLTEPNEVGNLMLATIGAGFGYWPVASRRNKVLTAVVIIGAAAQGVMADSRSPFVGIAIGCAIYLVWKYRIRGMIAVAALFAVFYTAALAIPSMNDYLGRGDVGSFTGRQVAWDFAVHSVKESPILGYGFEVEGQILHSQYFPDWDDVWGLGYHSSLHDGFVSRAVSLGVPALIFWLFLTLRPMVSCFFYKRDPWSLGSIVPLALLPILILNFTESIADFRSFAGLMMAVAWALLERERLFAQAQAAMRAKSLEASTTPIVRALRAGHAS